MAETNYNCECDDVYPRKTLLKMRTQLIMRLGFGTMVWPPGVAELCDSFLQEAQELLYRRYDVFRMERWFAWVMQPGVRFYGLLGNLDACTKKFDPRKVTWVGISQGDDQWRTLICGINPINYGTDHDSIPQFYEIRQCVEVWPAPDDATWRLRVKGHFELGAFAADADVTTIDHQAIAMLALANAKAHYGQPDAGNYMQQLQVYIGDLTAGSHHTRRYVPGKREALNEVRPVIVQ